MALCEAFARLEPRSVLDVIDLDERKIGAQVRHEGAGYLMPLLARRRSAMAIVRQWCSYDAAIAREERIGELERLLTEVMWDLRRPSPDREAIARRIHRVLTGQ